MVHATQVALVDSLPYCPSQVLARDLVGSKMYPSENARVGDIVDDLIKRGVLQSDGGHRRIRQCYRMSIFAIDVSHGYRRAAARAAMVCGIAREARSHDEGSPVRITGGFRVAVGVARMDCRFRTPKVVGVFVEE